MYNKLKLEDITIHYDFFEHPNKNAETIVLTHGNGWDLTGWDYVIDSFKREYNILRYDFRGQGKSYTHKETPLSWNQLFKDLETLLTYLNIREIHLIGHSLGGNFAIELARNKKTYLKSMVLIATPIYLPKKISSYEINRRNSWGEQNYRDSVDELLKNLCYPPAESKIRHLKRMYDQVDYQTYIEYFNLCAETALEYELESFNEIKIPVLFLAGEFDPLYPPRLQMMYYHYFKKSRFFIIPESSNAVMIDQPQKFTHQINLFLNSLNTDKIEDFNYFGVLDKELDDIVDTGLKIKNDEIHLKLIGEFQLIIDGKIVKGKWNQRKAMPIISYIIYHKTVTREELYEAFWPNSAIKNASNQLSVTLNHIKNLIESSTQKAFDYYFEVNRDWIGLKVEAEIDLLQFQQTLKEIENEFMIEKKTKWLISLLKQLNGGLNSLIYDDWFINLIRSIENQIQSICENLFNSQINEGDRIELLKEMVKHKVIEEENFKKLLTLLKQYNDKDYLFYKKKYDQLVNF